MYSIGVPRRIFSLRSLGILGRLGILGLLGFMVCSAVAASEVPALNSEAAAGRPLTEVLLELHRQGLDLLFTSQTVRPEMVVSEVPPGAPSRRLLETLLHPFGLTTQDGPGETLIVISQPGAGPGSGIHGQVREIRTGRPLEDVQILIPGSSFTAISGAEGRFTLAEVPPGTYTLEARRPGFVVEQTDDFVMPPWGVAHATLELLRTPLSLDKVVVTPSQISLLRSDPVPALALSRDEIAALPHLGDDLFRTMTLLPGASGNELTAQFHIRGGRTDEVMVVLDQLELIEPFHLKDFLNAFSIIAPKAIAEVDLILGGFPAQFGDRMGGVLNMKTSVRSGDYRTHLAISVLGAQAGSSGNFSKDRGHWLTVSRFGFPEVFLSYLNDNERPRYWDLFTKVELEVTPSHRFSARILHADDTFDIRVRTREEGEVDTERVDTDYQSSYGWLTHQGLLSSRLLVDTVLSRGNVERDRHSVETEGEDDGFVLDDLRSLDVTGLKQEWSFQPSNRRYWSWGFDLRRLETDFDYFNFRELDDPLAAIRFEPRSGTRTFRRVLRDDQGGGYISSRLRLGRSVTAEVGLRYDQHTITDDKDTSPRLNIALALDETSVLRGSWGYFFQSQRPYELGIEDGETEFLPSERTELFALGYEKIFRRGATLRLDAYHREVRDPRLRYENIFEPITSFPEIEPDRIRIVPERSTSRGVEFFYRFQRRPRFNGWIGYTYSRVEDRISGRDVPRSLDQPHALKVDLDIRVNPHWTLNLAFRYHTGWPTTAIGAALASAPGEDEADDDEDDLPLVPTAVFGPLNAERLAGYHRLDLRASRQWQINKGKLSFFLDLQNLYDRENVAGQDVDLKFEIAEGEGVNLIPVEERWGGFLPSIGIKWEF